MFYRTVPLALLLAGLVSSVPTPEPTPLTAVQNELCSTPACNQAADYIRVAINESVNPCTDFYEFACGGWIANHTIPPERSRIGTFDTLDEIMEKQIMEELKQLNITNVNQPQVTRLAGYYFEKCLEVENQHEDVGWEYLQEAYLAVLGDLDRFTWTDMLAYTYARAGIMPIFSFTIYQDSKHNDKNIITVSYLHSL